MYRLHTVLVTLVLCGFASRANSQNVVLHNQNDYDVFVAIGHAVNFADVGNRDTVSSKGWYRIPAKGVWDTGGRPSHLYVRFHRLNDSSPTVIRPRLNTSTQTFYLSDRRFDKKFYKGQVNSDNRGGPATFYGLYGFRRSTNSNRFEIVGPSVVGTKVLKLLAVRNESGSTIFLRFRWDSRDDWSREHELAAGQTFYWNTGDDGDLRPQIRFDHSVVNGFQEGIYNLDTFRVKFRSTDQPGWNDSRQYVLRRSGNLIRPTNP